MSDQISGAERTVNTVLGPISAEQLGGVATHETLLSVYPGAEHAPEITIDRAEIFDLLAAKLQDFREHGGTTLVDASGMYHGRRGALPRSSSHRSIHRCGPVDALRRRCPDRSRRRAG